MSGVKFIETTSAYLDTLPVVDGQIIALTDQAGLYYDKDSTRYQVASGGTGGGHVIEDADGTDMTQRANLQFTGYLDVSDDSTNDRTVISAAPTTVTWDAWNQMSTSQKEGTKWLITDAPGSIPGDLAIFVLRSQTLTFTNKVATVSDSRITAGCYPLVYWSDASYSSAVAAGITASTSAGTITFTASTQPSSALTCDLVFIDAAMVDNSRPVSHEVTVPTTGYTYASVFAWGETKMLYTKYITTDKDGTSMTDFHSGMYEDIPLHVTGSQSDFGKLFSYSIVNGGVNIYMTAVPSAEFNILVREAV